jgi:hypothetical protein
MGVRSERSAAGFVGKGLIAASDLSKSEKHGCRKSKAVDIIM